MSDRSPRIVVVAFAGSDNLGDECILAAEVAAIRRQYPQAWISAPAVRRSRVASIIDCPIRQTDLAALRREIRRADLVVLGGGGILQDDTSVLNLLYFLIPMAYCNRIGVPTVGYGLGAGPIHRPWLRALTRRVLSGMTALCVRDDASRALLLDIGVAAAKIRVTADPAICLGSRLAATRGREAARPRVAVALRTYSGRSASLIPRAWAHRWGPIAKDSQDALAVRLAPALRWMARELDAEFVFVAFQAERDEQMNRRAQDAAALADRAVDLPLPTSPNEVLRTFAGCDLVLGMRLHACILAAAVGTPFAALSYTSKVREFAESVGAGAATVDLDDASEQDILETIQRSWAARDGLRETLRVHSERAVEAESGNLRVVLDILGDPPGD